MALYAASKHALEDYSESVDHEVREYGVRVVLIEPGPTSTSFDAATVRPRVPLSAYARRRERFTEVVAGSTSHRDDPATGARVPDEEPSGGWTCCRRSRGGWVEDGPATPGQLFFSASASITSMPLGPRT